MSNRDKWRSIGSVRRTNHVREGRDSEGKRFKAVTDELGHTVTERAGDRQDVTINANALTVSTTVNEVN